MPIFAWLLMVALLSPCNAHAGWFGWFFGGQTKTVIVAPPGTQAVPALDGYGMAAAIGCMITLMRRRMK